MATPAPATPAPAPPAAAADSSSDAWNVETIIACPGEPGKVSNYYGPLPQVQAIYDQWTAALGQPYPGYPGCSYGSATEPEPVNAAGTVAAG